jgi:crotonobetainyl-CoA:carnitine CoA-transferase CaiB-like acyl-CoA transferase
MSALLEGLLTVDLSRALAGPHAPMMLGDLGARVIKIETPDGGDDTRDQELPRRSHSALPTLDQHGPALRAELGLDRTTSPEWAAQ